MSETATSDVATRPLGEFFEGFGWAWRFVLVLLPWFVIATRGWVALGVVLLLDLAGLALLLRSLRAARRTWRPSRSRRFGAIAGALSIPLVWWIAMMMLAFASMIQGG